MSINRDQHLSKSNGIFNIHIRGNVSRWTETRILFPGKIEVAAYRRDRSRSYAKLLIRRRRNATERLTTIPAFTTATRDSACVVSRFFRSRSQIFSVCFPKALVEETQHEIDQLGHTHDDEDGILKSLLRDASPFLFPCTIEFSLICAVILFEMWKRVDETIDSKNESPTRSSYHLSIDCSSSHRSEISLNR